MNVLIIIFLFLVFMILMAIILAELFMVKVAIIFEVEVNGFKGVEAKQTIDFRVAFA